MDTHAAGPSRCWLLAALGLVGAAAPAPIPERAGYAIQLGLFRDQDNAAALIRIATEAGYAPQMVDRPGSDGRVWHALMLGWYPDRQTAGQVAASLRRDSFVRGIVVAVPAGPQTSAPGEPKR